MDPDESEEKASDTRTLLRFQHVQGLVNVVFSEDGTITVRNGAF